MALSSKTKQKLHKIIFERAYEIESRLSENDYFLASLSGLKPEQVSDMSLKIAIKELKKEFTDTKS